MVLNGLSLEEHFLRSFFSPGQNNICAYVLETCRFFVRPIPLSTFLIKIQIKRASNSNRVQSYP